MDAVRLVEGLADGGCDVGVLAPRDMGQGVAHPVIPAPLPSRLEDTGYGCLEAGVCIADHQLDASEAPGAERTQEFGPEGLAF